MAKKNTAKDGAVKRGLFQRIADFLFGYDFFISYCWADGRHYAVELQRKLADHGFTCFLDSSDYAKGDNWRAAGQRALKKTSRLILVGTPKAVLSEPVANELRIFSGLKRRVFPIDLGGALSGIGTDEGVFKYLDPDMLRVLEGDSALHAGPSEEVVSQINASFNLLRQDQKRTRWFAGLTTLFGMVAAVAVFFFFLARAETVRANGKTTEALENLSSADLGLAKISLENDQTNEGLFRLWEAYSHAPAGDWRKESALRLIHGWLPFAGHTIQVQDVGSLEHLSPGGRWAIHSGEYRDGRDYLVDVATGKVITAVSDQPRSEDFYSPSPVYSFSPDEWTLAARLSPSSVRIFNLKNPSDSFVYQAGTEFETMTLRNSRELFISSFESGGALQLRDIVSNRLVRSYPLFDDQGPVQEQNILLSADGSKVLGRGSAGVGFWEVESAEQLHFYGLDHPDSFFWTNCDGSIAAMFSFRHGSSVFTRDTGDSRETSDVLESQYNLGLRGHHFHPLEPRKIAIQTSTSQVEVRDLPSDDGRRSVQPTMSFGHDFSVSDFQFSRDGRLLVIRGKAGSYTLWKIPPPIPRGEFSEAQFKEGRRYCTLVNSERAPMIVCDPEDVLNSPIRQPDRGYAESLAVSPDRSRGAAIFRDSGQPELVLFDPQNGQPVSASPLYRGEGLSRLFFDTTSRTLIGLSSDGGIRCWSSDIGALLKQQQIPSTGADWSFVLNPSGDHFIAIKRGGTQSWQVVDGIPSFQQEFKTSQSRPLECDISADGKWMAIADSGRKPKVEIIEISSGRKTTVRPPVGESFAHILLSNNGGRVAMSQAADVYIYDTQSGERLAGPIEHPGIELINEFMFSPNGDLLAIEKSKLESRSVGNYTEVQIWDVRTGTPLGRPIRRTSGEGFSGSRIMDFSDSPFENWEEFSSLANEPERRILLTLELLTGTAFGDAGERSPLNWQEVQDREAELKNFGGPLIPFPAFPDAAVPQVASSFAPATSRGLDQNDPPAESLVDFLKRWIAAGNSNSSGEIQSRFYANSAVINDKMKSRATIAADDQAFERAFPVREFSLVGYQLVSQHADKKTESLVVHQSALIVGPSGNEKQLQFSDKVVIETTGRQRKIISRIRVK